MPRDLRSESEFGLPVLPDPFGDPIAEDATGTDKITGLSDSDAIKAGAGGVGAALGGMSTTGAELRAIYGFGEGELLPASTLGNNELVPVVKKK